MRYISNAQPLVPPIANLNSFTMFKRPAIPEPILGPDFPKLLLKLLQEVQLQFFAETIVLSVDSRGAQQLRTARLQSLAESKEELLPHLELVICWYQQYASSGPAISKVARVYDSDQRWYELMQASNAVTVHLNGMSGSFFENTPFGRPLDTSHSWLRPPNLVRQGE